MAKNITTENDGRVMAFINAISDPERRKDCFEIITKIKKITGLEARMWGTAIIGFGAYHYKYKSGHEGDAPLVAFASRVNAIVLYLATDEATRSDMLQKLGKHKAGKSCIYIKKLSDINIPVFETMVTNSIMFLNAQYPQ